MKMHNEAIQRLSTEIGELGDLSKIDPIVLEGYKNEIQQLLNITSRSHEKLIAYMMACNGKHPDKLATI